MTRNSKRISWLTALPLLAIAAVVMTPAAYASGKHTGYSKSTVTKKASFHRLKKKARGLRSRGVANVKATRKHGRKVGFQKTFRSGEKVVVRKARHGRVTKTTLKPKSLLQRLKHRTKRFGKALKKRAHYLKKAVTG